MCSYQGQNTLALHAYFLNKKEEGNSFLLYANVNWHERNKRCNPLVDHAKSSLWRMLDFTHIDHGSHYEIFF